MELNHEQVPNGTHSIEELIKEALNVGDPDEHAYWDPINELWHLGSPEVLEAAQNLCQSTSSNERLLGANIIGQLGLDSNVLHEEKLHTLLTVLQSETDADILAATCISLSHLYDDRAHEAIMQLKDHPSEDVRYGVAAGLTGDLSEQAIATLIELSTDLDSDVRDWSTFRLGMIESASPEMLNALAARVADEDDDTRAEAIVGLARKKDQRAVEPLKKYLSSLKAGNHDWSYVEGLLYEAAAELANPEICPELLQVKSVATGDEYLDEALEKCGCEAQ